MRRNTGPASTYGTARLVHWHVGSNIASALEWVNEIMHISGNTQLWTVTSKKLAAKILNQLINGKSVLDVTKRKTSPSAIEVEYDVVGVR